MMACLSNVWATGRETCAYVSLRHRFKSRSDDITIEKHTIETNLNPERVTLEKAINNAFS